LNGDVPWFRVEDIRENGRTLNSAIQMVSNNALKGNGPFPANSLLLSTSATIGEYAFVTVPHLSNQRFVSMSLRTEFEAEVTTNFLPVLGQILSAFAKANATDSGSFPSISTQELKRMLLPIPSLDEQERIATIISKFDALVNDISIGLPAEISARRKQYEYYRDKLLTFPEVAA
jgi:type I restriction enzyme S subunit